MRWTAVLACLLVAGCAAVEPDIVGPLPAEAATARARLVAVHRDGPVRIEVHDAPTGLPPARVASLAATGVSGLSVRFALAGAPPEPRLVLQFGRGDPYALCVAPAAERDTGAPLHLLAAFCDGPRTIAALAATAAGPDARAVERLVWRATDRLFPDDYEERYGLRLFGDRVRFGLSGEFGF
jgi:hypothetical protein